MVEQLSLVTQYSPTIGVASSSNLQGKLLTLLLLAAAPDVADAALLSS